jgi:methylenetetrahydrofolate dehydrogenase (NADP+) / methenyltetrahydrofolate cyclohydrolase
MLYFALVLTWATMMTCTIIDGKKIAAKLELEIKDQVASLDSKPTLAVILLGHDAASEVYVRKKHEACERIGIRSSEYSLDNDTSEAALLDLIHTLNEDPDTHGILVQLPLPDHISTQTIIETILPLKDVDGFHPFNLGRLAQRNPMLTPCTPAGVMHLLKAHDIDPKGLDATVVGASYIVGRPLALELTCASATVTVCHKSTRDLESHIRNADIVATAVGKPGLIKGEWIKPGAIVIDIGITRLDNGKLAGDVEFDKAFERAGFITPVPGGVGPMTVVMLMSNTLKAYHLQHVAH